MFAAVFTVLAAAAVCVHADPNPTSPGPGDVFIQGQTCTINWEADTTGLWKAMTIELMTGDNFDMVPLTTVGTVDGTNPAQNTFSYPCPQVTPHSPIYFYQFTSPSTANKAWTGRFTITDSANDVVAPAQSTQPDGEAIPWGTGSLVDGSTSAAASSSVTLVLTAPAPDDTAPSTPTPNTPIPGTPAPGTPTTGRSSPSNVYVPSSSSASTTPSTASNSGANAAVATLSVSNILFQAGLALGLTAFGFAAMF